MTTYAYDISDATLAEVRELINRNELENQPIEGESHFVGDGANSDWYVAPPGYYIVEGTETVTVGGTAATYTLDYDSGIITMTETPTSGAEGICRFQAKAFTDFMVDRAINQAVDMLFPSFYISELLTSTTDGTSTEYELSDPIEVVTSVDYQGTTDTTWTKQGRNRYTIYQDGDSTYLRFYTAPSAGTLRVHAISRPSMFSDDQEALSDLGLPPRALGPIVAGAMFHLIKNKAAVRIRSDVAVATMGTGTVFPSMMTQVAQTWLMTFQFECQSLRMKPWIVR